MNNSYRFLNAIFKDFLSHNEGYIELRQKNARSTQIQRSFHSTVKNALKSVDNDKEVYFGVNPRGVKAGTKDAVHYVVALHADVDYGKAGHHKESYYSEKEEAIEAIMAFRPVPSIIVHTGGGYHAYWLIGEPASVRDKEELKTVESINRGIADALHGDSCHDISHFLRLPDTYNYKATAKRLTEIVRIDEKIRYSLDDFKEYLGENRPQFNEVSFSEHVDSINIDDLDLKENYKNLILNGGHVGYESRSEADHAVIYALVGAGLTDSEIRYVFSEYPIGEKYREKGNDGDKYLAISLEKARRDIGNRGDDNKNVEAGKKFDPEIYVKRVVGKEDLLYVDGQGFYVWRQAGFWEQLPSSHTDKLVYSVLDRPKRRGQVTEVAFSLRCQEGILLPQEKSMNQERELLNLRNGMFNPISRKLYIHDKKYLSTVQLDVSYNPSAITERFDGFLDEVAIDPQDRNTLQEYSGYCLTTDVSFEKALFLIGTGRNGKSVFAAVMANLLGVENVASISPNTFGQNFHSVGLLNKLLNIAPDLDNIEIRHVGIWKAIISGEPVTDSFKGQDRFNFVPFAKHIYCMNNAPKVNDKSEAFYKRLLIVRFPRVFSDDEMDRTLKRKLIDEKEGIFIWALEGLHRLKAQGMFTESENSKSEVAEYRKKNNPILVFSLECLRVEPAAETKKDELYERYLRWCTRNDVSNQGKESFFISLYEIFPHVRPVRKMKHRKSEHYIAGLAFLR